MNVLTISWKNTVYVSDKPLDDHFSIERGEANDVDLIDYH